jgi:hypothetical protein
MLADDRFSDTDADRHDAASRNGSSGLRGVADSAEMGGLGGVISEPRECRCLCGNVFAWLVLRVLGLDCVSVGSAFCASIWLLAAMVREDLASRRV